MVAEASSVAGHGSPGVPARQGGAGSLRSGKLCKESHGTSDGQT